MKKIFLAILMCFIMFSTFALEGVIVDVLGKVEKQSGNSWVALKKGDKLFAGDVISTGFKSEAVLSIGESVVTVRALTRMTIEQLVEKNQNHVSSVYLDVGSITADVKPVENKRVGFTVKTPAVTASVRGTAGNIYAYGKVEGIRGKWGLSAPQPKMIVKDNSETQVTTTESANQEGVNQPNINQDVASQDAPATNPDANNNEIDQEIPPVEVDADINLDVDLDVDINLDVDLDVDIEEMLAGFSNDEKVFVNAGEVAYVSPVKTGNIVPPKETKKEETAAANNTIAEAESKPITENNVSTNITEKLKETTSDIFVEIIIPDMAE